MKVPFLDLRILDTGEKRELVQAISKVFTHGRIVLGPEVGELEKKLARFHGRRYCVGVNSGTDALFLGLKSLGLEPGDEVITTSLSWIATANAIALSGATPVFADIGADLNIDPESIKKLINRKTRAILPVHYTGKVCRMEEILKIAERNKLTVIEDAAQAFGARYRGGLAGTFGRVACFSANPMKIFAACGEAGFILTDEERIYENLISLRYNGTVNKETCIAVSLNGRIDTIQAAILLARLKRVGKIISIRRKNAAYYRQMLAGIRGIIALPQDSADGQDIYYTFQVRVTGREELMKYLAAHGIETKIQHPILMPDQPVYAKFARDRLTNARTFIKEILCLPIHEKLSRQQLAYVALNVKKFYQEKN